MKNAFKKGLPRNILEQLPLPLYKTAVNVYDLFNTYTYNKDDSFKSKNQTPEGMIVNSELMEDK